MTIPVVGITIYPENDEGRFDLPVEYVQAVRRAGAIAVLMPPGEPHLGEWLATLDALVLAGGGDLDPALYGGTNHATVDRVDRQRDDDEMELCRQMLAGRMPCLAICRGTQILNVTLGGTLIEHLPEKHGDTVVHRSPEGNPVPHSVEVDADSRVGQIMQTVQAETFSQHHQALGEIARGLKVVAKAPDGVIEAVELPEHPWLLAVQWHPEISAPQDPSQQNLFDALVEQARRGERR